mgnify:FL=1
MQTPRPARSPSVPSPGASRSRPIFRTSTSDFVMFSRNPLYAYLSLVPSQSRLGSCITKASCPTNTYVNTSSKQYFTLNFITAPDFRCKGRLCMPCETISTRSATCTATQALSWYAHSPTLPLAPVDPASPAPPTRTSTATHAQRRALRATTRTRSSTSARRARRSRRTRSRAFRTRSTPRRSPAPSRTTSTRTRARDTSRVSPPAPLERPPTVSRVR